VLWGIVLGTVAYSLFAPLSLSRIGQSGWLWAPSVFPFGFSVNPVLVALFFLMLTTASCTALSQYHLVSRWGNEAVSSTRMSAGIFTESVGAAVAAVVGGMSTTAYPDCVGILKVSRVGSVFVTVMAGAVLLVLGFVLKFDAVFVVIPSSVIAAAATVMFGMILVAAVGMLRDVQWDTLNSIVLGFPFMVSLGGLFVSPATLQTYPLLLRTAIGQPILTGSLLIVVLHLTLNVGLRPWWARKRSAETPARASAT
jgi:xanthine/uracil permease